MGDRVDETEAPPPLINRIQITIQRMYSISVTFLVNEHINIMQLKVRIACRSSVYPSLQRLLFRGRALMDDQVLSDYNVQHGDTLFLVVRQPIPRLSDSSTTNAAGEPIFTRRMLPTQRGTIVRSYQNPNTGLVVRDPVSYVSAYITRCDNSQTAMGTLRTQSVVEWIVEMRRQLLIGDIAESFSSISLMLANRINPTDPVSVLRQLGGIRANESETLLLNLGYSLIELGRAISRLSMGEEYVSADVTVVEPSIGIGRLPLVTTPRNIDILRHVQVGIQWPLPSIEEEEELEDSHSEEEMVERGATRES